jgi:hypothetical protein
MEGGETREIGAYPMSLICFVLLTISNLVLLGLVMGEGTVNKQMVWMFYIAGLILTLSSWHAFYGGLQYGTKTFALNTYLISQIMLWGGVIYTQRQGNLPMTDVVLYGVHLAQMVQFILATLCIFAIV